MRLRLSNVCSWRLSLISALCLLSHFSHAQQVLIPAGSFLLNMGIQYQTIENGLKPYGLVYDLVRNHQVPVIWSIDPNKGKDGIDFTYNGTHYRGGTFVISSEFLNNSIEAVITAWVDQGVVGEYTSLELVVPFYSEIDFVPTWTLDQKNGRIAEVYFQNAGIPSTAYNWKLPSELSCCEDLFIMPHADPTWETHGNLLQWNDQTANGGCEGSIWAACHAVSVLEAMSNPGNSAERANFLSIDQLVSYNEHSDGTIPPPYLYDAASHPVMQFMGLMDQATHNGSEQIFLPNNAGWRPETQILIWDSDHPDIPGTSPGAAAKLVVGDAFGNPDRGKVIYQGGHNHAKSEDPANIAAQRAFLNFSFWAAERKAIEVSGNLGTTLEVGKAAALSATASGGSGTYYYQWQASCSGTFSNPTAPNTEFVPHEASQGGTCVLTCIVTDACGTRTGFFSEAVTIVPAPAAPVALNDYQSGRINQNITINALANDSDPNLDLLSFTFRDSSTDTLATVYGTFIHEGSGVVIYYPGLDFVGLDTAYYVVRDTTAAGAPAFGPLSDTAIIEVSISNLDPFGCQIGLETFVESVCGYANEVIVAYDIGGGQDKLLGKPDGKTADFHENDDSVIIDFLDVLPGGDTIDLFLTGVQSDAQIEVSVSSDLTTFSNLIKYTQPDNLDTGEDTLKYYLPPGTSARYLKVKNTLKSGASTNQDFNIDGFKYRRGNCLSCVLPDVVEEINGTGEIEVNVNGLDQTGNSIGAPDGSGTRLNDVTDTLLLRLPDTVPNGGSIFLYLASNNDMITSLQVKGSVDSLGAAIPFTLPDTFSTSVKHGDAFIQFTYDVNQSAGIKFLMFTLVAGDCHLDGVEYKSFHCQDIEKPIAANDTIAMPFGTFVNIAVQGNDQDVSGNGMITKLHTAFAPAHGLVSLVGPDIVYTPYDDFTGVDSFRYIVCDQLSNTLCDTASVYVTVINEPPVAADDIDSTNTCETEVLHALLNDSDPETGLLSIVEIIVPPDSGTVFITDGGQTLTYTPFAGFGFPDGGFDTLFYRVCDNGIPQLCDTARIIIKLNEAPVNYKPVANPDQTDEPVVNQPVYIPVLDNDTDLDQDILTVSLPPGILVPSNGSVSITANQKIEYIPNPGFRGSDSFQYVICDNHPILGPTCDTVPELCDTGLVMVTVRNQAPIARPDHLQTGQDQAKQLHVLINDLDPDLDTIRLQTAGSNMIVDDGLTTLGGMISINDNGTPLIFSDDFIDYSPPAGQSGQTDTFNYVISDNLMTTLFDTATVYVALKENIDLELSKSVEPLQASVGDTVVFTVAVDNKGPGFASNVTVRDQLPDGLKYLSDNKVNAYDPTSGIWFVDTLLSGEKDTILLSAEVLNLSDATNIAEVFGSNEFDLDSEPNNYNTVINEDDEALATVGLPSIGVAKQIISIEKPAQSKIEGNSNVTYRYIIKNLGPLPLEDISLVEDLGTQMGGSFRGIVSGPTIHPDSKAFATGGVNPDYTARNDSIEILDSLAILEPSDSLVVDLIVEIDPNHPTGNFGPDSVLLNQVYASGQNSGTWDHDLSDDGPNPSGDNGSGGEDDPTPLRIKEIAGAKAFAYLRPAVSGIPGNLDVKVILRVENAGNDTLRNIGLTDHLASTANLGSAFKGVVTLPIISRSSASVNPGINPGFNGSSDIGILDTTGMLAPGEGFTVEFYIEIDPDDPDRPAELSNVAICFYTTPDPSPLIPNEVSFLLSHEFVGDTTDHGLDPLSTNTSFTGDSGGSNDPAMLVLSDLQGSSPCDPIPALFEKEMSAPVNDTIDPGTDASQVNMFDWYPDWTPVMGNNDYFPSYDQSFYDISAIDIPDSCRVPGMGQTVLWVSFHSAAGVNSWEWQLISTGPDPKAVKFILFVENPCNRDCNDLIFYKCGASFNSWRLNDLSGFDVSQGLRYHLLMWDTTANQSGNVNLKARDPQLGSGTIACPLPEIAAVKYVDTIRYSAESGTIGNVDVTLGVLLKNIGTDTLFNVQLTDDLATQFSSAFAGIPPSGSGVTVFDVQATIPPTVNSQFDGTDNDSLFATRAKLAPGDSLYISFEVEIDPNAMSAPIPLLNTTMAMGTGFYGDEVRDSSDAGIKGSLDPEGTNPGAPGDKGTDDDPLEIHIPLLSLLKFIDTVNVTPSSGIVGNMDLTLGILVKNIGNDTLCDVQVRDDLFGHFESAYYGVPLSGSQVTVRDWRAVTAPVPNTDFDGAGNDSLFITPGKLAVNDSVFVEFTVEVDPNADAAPMPLFNSAIGTGLDPLGLAVSDSSDAADRAMLQPEGTNPGGPGDSGGVNDPLMILLPNLNLAKALIQFDPAASDIAGNVDATLRYTIKNTGNVYLDSILLFDDLVNQLDVTLGSILSVGLPVGSGIDLERNTDYDGTTGSKIVTDGLLAPNGSFYIDVVLEMDPNASGAPNPLKNQAFASAIPSDMNGDTLFGPGNLPLPQINDLSDSGLLPESTNPEDPCDQGTSDDSTQLLLPVINLAKALLNVIPAPDPVVSPSSAGNVYGTIRYTLKNSGNTVLNTIALTDTLPAQLGSTFVQIISVGSPVGGGTGITHDATWDGSMRPELITGGSLEPGDSFMIDVILEFNPNASNRPDPLKNQAKAYAIPWDDVANDTLTGAAGLNLPEICDKSDAGFAPESQNYGIPGDSGGSNDSTVLLLPNINLSKSVTDFQLLTAPPGPIGNFSVTYLFKVKNTGNIPLDSITVHDNIFGQYGGISGAFVGIRPGGEPSIVSGGGTLVSTNLAFDGGATDSLLILPLKGPDGSLPPDSTICIEITVEINPNAMSLPNDPLLNQAIGMARPIDGAGNGLMERVKDFSDSGADPEDVNDEAFLAEPGYTNDSTALELAALNIAKEIIEYESNFSDTLAGDARMRFKIWLKNKGNVPATDVEVTDDILKQYGPVLENILQQPTFVLESNPGGYVTPIEGMVMGSDLPEDSVLCRMDVIQPNVLVSMEFEAHIDPNADDRPEPLLNQASVRGVAENGGNSSMVFDISDTGSDPESANGGALGNTGGEDDPTHGPAPSVNVAKTIPFPGVRIGSKTRHIIVSQVVRLKNTGNVPLDSVRLQDPVGDTSWYGKWGAFVGIPTSPVIQYQPAGSDFSINPGFDGLSSRDPNLLIPSTDMTDLIPVNDSLVIRFEVEIDTEFIPEDSILLNQAIGFGTGLWPDGGRREVMDPSDSGTRPESNNVNDVLRQACELPDMGHNDPTPLPYCFRCPPVCLDDVSTSFDENCELDIIDVIKNSTRGIKPICADLGFFDFEIRNKFGGLVSNPIRGEQIKGEECFMVTVWSVLCPNNPCWTNVCIKRFDKPIIFGRDTTVHCGDPLIAGPDPAEQRYAVGSCQGQIPANFTGDWIDVIECDNGNQDTAKVIYRQYEATSNAGFRGTGWDTIYVLRPPEISVENLYCPASDTTYCGEGERNGPYLIFDAATGRSCDTIFFLNPDGSAAALDPECGLSVSVATFELPSQGCIRQTRYDVQIYQSCYGSPIDQNCSIDNTGGPHFEITGGSGDAVTVSCSFWVMDIDTMAPLVECQLAELGKVEEINGIDAVVVAATSNDCSTASASLPPISVNETCGAVKLVKARLEDLGTFIYQFNPSTGLYESNEVVDLPLREEPYELIFEAVDDCHNIGRDRCYLIVQDLVIPVSVTHKGLTLSLGGKKKAWLPANDLDNGSYDNCKLNLVLARRTDWYTACVDLCDSLIVDHITPKGDTIWCVYLADDKLKNEVEAHYRQTLEWLNSDEGACAGSIAEAFHFDLCRYATVHCKGSLTLEEFEHAFTGGIDSRLTQLGGGWSASVPFSCEDACQTISVELLVMDYWCNWSTSWTDILVEDKSAVEPLVQLTPELIISCTTYKNDSLYQLPGQAQLLPLADVMEASANGDLNALALLNEVLGGYHKAWRDDYGQFVDSEGNPIDAVVEFTDRGICTCTSAVEEVTFYDEQSQTWVTENQLVTSCFYDQETLEISNGIMEVNCGRNSFCRQSVEIDLDECGIGTVRRIFKVWKECTAATPEPPDTLTEEQVIFVGDTCRLRKEMFDLPEDSELHACQPEFDPEGSGNVVGPVHPDSIGRPQYLLDSNCRIVGIAHEDKVFSFVGGAEGNCYLIARTWYFADWCGQNPGTERWWDNPALVSDTFVQKIVLRDTIAPSCEVLVDGQMNDTITIMGCSTDFVASVFMMDNCQMNRYDWTLENLDPGGALPTTNMGGEFTESLSMDTTELVITGVEPGTYQMRIRVFDHCMNESYCVDTFTIVSNDICPDNQSTLNIHGKIINERDDLKSWDQSRIPIGSHFLDEMLIQDQFVLLQNWPNPFENQTIIGFYLPEQGDATMYVYDMQGKIIRQVEGHYNKGYHEIQFRRNDLKNVGPLYYRLNTEKHSASRMMILLN